MQHRCMRPLGSRPFGNRFETVPALLLAAAFVPGLTARPCLAQQQDVPAASAPAVSEPLITLDLRDARLEQAIAILAQKSGFNIVTEPANPSRPYSMVNVKLEDKPVSIVLKAIASSAGAVISDEDGIYHLRPRGIGETNPVPKAVAAPEATAVVQQPQRRKQTQLAKIALNYLLPSDVIRNFDDPTWLAYVQKQAPELAPPVQIRPFQDTAIKVLNINGSSGEVQMNPSAPPAGVPGTTAGRDGDVYSQGQRGLAGGGGQQGGRGGGFGGQGFGGQGGQGGIGGQQGGPGGQNGQQANLRPAGIQNLVASDADNSLIVDYDDVDDLARLREIVKLLDVAPKQVNIKAEFVSVGIQDADSYGIDWNITPSNNINAIIPPAAGTTPTFTLAYASGNAVANLRLALTRSTSNILQSPIISTTNNRPASIVVSRTITIQQTVNVATQTGTLSNTNQVPVSAQNQLIVTPHINGDNSITMTLQPQLQTITPLANGGFTSDSQQLSTTRRVQNGETMVLGGFITKNETNSITRVPFLSDLPVVGKLFTQKDRTVSGSEVLVFITPTIIEDRAQGTIGTGGTAPSPTP